MSVNYFHKMLRATGATALVLGAGIALAEPKHGIAMYGEPQLAPDFLSLPYANIDAPTGGYIATGEVGGFDSLNPHIQKGRSPWQLRFIGYESLMGRNYDEPFALYGLLAESIETSPERDWVEFTLRPEARFSDGSPVTVEDVMWSYETLGTQGHPRYRGVWSKIESMEKTGDNKIKFTFNVEDRELALIVGMRPVLKKAQWDGKDFTQSGLDTIPISSGPYVIDDFEAGRYISLKRNPDYWGHDVPFRRGTNKLDEIRLEYFGDDTALFEAFKAGILNSQREFNAEKWVTQYDFPAIDAGEVVKSEIPHARPTGITGFVMNTRREQFADWRVREALIHAFNFEYINETITGARNPRITSYFSNSVLGMSHGPAEGKVKDFLMPFADELLPGALDGYTLPVSDGTQRNRGNLRKALALMEEAGWTVQDGVMANAEGTPFTFEILIRSGQTETGTFADIYAQALDRMGIDVTITEIDSPQYKERTQDYDFDMTYYRRGLSLSPGNEQNLYWGSAGVTEPGSRNWMGMNSPAAEAMIDKLLNSTSRDDFLAATKALDRILTSGRYVIPFYQFTQSRIAHAKELSFPEYVPIYGDWIGWQPDVWYWEDK